MTEPLDFLPISGLRLASAATGIRYPGRDDLVLLEMAPGSSCAAVFTRNAFCAAPVRLARAHLAETPPRYLLINSGNANAGTGSSGLQAAEESCRILAEAAACPIEAVLPFSTGVIGEPLPLAPFRRGIPQLLADLNERHWPQAARAIMTTDTRPKLVSRQREIGGQSVRLTGMAKGSGMIQPNMATLLAYLATDAALAPELLQQALQEAIEPSFNSISVDGDTSTNDACVLVATGRSGLSIDDLDTEAGQALRSLLLEVCMELAEAIVRDGEGATKLIPIQVSGARSVEEARQVGFTIAHSPLVKTAMFASDPNWGRILAAVGRSGIPQLQVEGVRIWLGDVLIVEQGGRAASYREELGQAVMNRTDIPVRIELGRGEAEARILTCDLSFDYVKINAEYRS
ncbi:MAG: bifunctional glutamate N-acetyltransferase/amino-acid acetyltransferase ArgJ [Gammaproteobacteria bacterium SHHR-1]|uniref:bifunctional glutamate N-acetyltransferase/amino-acid acetyltransferase ArgJ n=1 Tax=Magnetovirga frankeli TaxID=947516 RepID=UPI00129402AA|nr:bifunctional glutamate N-acetyltransferase/amino-acid acetyltransferase ArgJ [gamma proteobacterium SS-5]